MQEFPDENDVVAGVDCVSAAWRGHADLARSAAAQPKGAITVDNGNNGDGCERAVAPPARVRLHRVILRRWETIAEVRETDRDCPDAQRHPIRMRPGDRPPVLDTLRSPSNVGLPGAR